MSSGTTRKKAAKGEGADRKDVTKMVNCLRYNSTNCKDEQKKKEAAAALYVYKGLGGPEQRKRFLKEFEEAGSGRGSGSLKFALSFSQTLAQETSVSTTLKEIWLTRPAWGLGLMCVCGVGM